MGVIGSAIIFCEGKQTSLDYRLLQPIISSIPTSIPPTVVPSGSKFTFSIFAEGYFSSGTGIYQTVRPPYIVFRDRDFDLLPTPDVQLLHLPDQNRVFLTYRACVENYLLDVELLHRYWSERYEEKRQNPSSKWGHKDSPGISKIAEWLETAATALRDYQAVRWALADLLQIRETRDQLKTTWTGSSGTLPNSLNLQDCCNDALALIGHFRTALEKVTPERFAQSLEKYQQQFAAASFWEKQEYLIWFHGKDLQKVMQKQQQSYISLDDFFHWAVSRLDITAHADLRSLRTEIEKLVTQK